MPALNWLVNDGPRTPFNVSARLDMTAVEAVITKFVMSLFFVGRQLHNIRESDFILTKATNVKMMEHCFSASWGHDISIMVHKDTIP